MVLEATVIILDNSEWMRNGDFTPSRFDVQSDAATLICNVKRQSNVENSVAVMTMSGAPEVKVTLTSEQSKLQHAVATTHLNGGKSCNFSSALQVAQLVLKNRQNPNQRQKVVAFLGSPLNYADESSLEGLVSVGKMLKKNGVSLDIICFGAVGENSNLISTILASTAGLDLSAAKKNIHEQLLTPGCECHLLTVNPGDNLIEQLKSSPILVGSDGSSIGDFGMDEDMDPELAMALKLSLEEEKNRLERERGSGAPENTNVNEDSKMAIDDEDDEEAMMARAIAMSMESAQKESQQKTDHSKQ